MSDTTTEKADKAKAKPSNGTLLSADEDEMAQALALFRSLPKDQRKSALIEAQMAALGEKAYHFLKDGYKKLTGKDLSDVIVIDGQTGHFCDIDDIEDEDEDDTDEDGDEDEEFDIDGDEDDTDGDTDEDEEPTYTAAQAVRMLRKWMKANDKSQVWVANKLKVSQPAVSTWMARTSYPREASIKRIVKLCEG